MGRWWWPPSSLLEAGAATSDPLLAGAAALERAAECEEDDDNYLWYCEPCWCAWLVRYKQWYVEEGWTADSINKCGEAESTSASGSGSSSPSSSSTSSAFCSPSGSGSGCVSPPPSSVEGYCSPSPPRDGAQGGCRAGRWRRWPEGKLAPGEEACEDEGGDGHFDFVEIGTSNYHTFTQSIASHPDGKPHAWLYLRWSEDPTTLRGLAVDMKRRYLDQLPDLPRVEKVRAAVSERDSLKRMYHVPVRDVDHWEGIFAARGSKRGYRAVRLARGCSALGRHRVLRRALGHVGLRHLIRVRRVKTRGVDTLLESRGVQSIGVLALDCEGHDCNILKGLMRACDSKPKWYPRWILFETNGMNDEIFGEGTERRTVKALKKRGYKVWYGGGYWESGKRDTVLKRLW